ncbi:MAG: hypothetical protein WCM76_03315 [Bacteroidota bacterium]
MKKQKYVFRRLVSVTAALLLCCCMKAVAQDLMPLSQPTGMAAEKYLNRRDARIFLAYKPLISDNTKPFLNPDSALIPGCKINSPSFSYARRKIFYENFLKVDSAAFFLAADPLFDFRYGKNTDESRSYYHNMRGFRITANFGHKLALSTTFYENQARFPKYINDFIKKYEVAPGDGRVKDFKGTGWDYGTALGSISYSPSKHYNIQFGHDKVFIGNGYRSLLLSDNAFQFPHLQFTVSYGIFRYTTLFASFMNLDTKGVLNADNVWYHGYQKKGGTFNYLSIIPAKGLEIGLFEGTIWEAGNSRGRQWNLNHFIPVIGLNTIRYGLSSNNNVLTGLDIRYSIINSIQLYGQFMLDDISLKDLKNNGYLKNKYGYQFGMKYWDMFGLQNLNLRIEYNRVRPYAYAHRDPLQSYTHYNQSLAHPLGANFSEALSIVSYRYRRVWAEVSFSYAQVGADSADSHWGQNIFTSDYDAEKGYNSYENRLLQGEKTNIMNGTLEAGFLFNPKTNLSFIAGIATRSYKNSFTKTTVNYYYFGISTNLSNHYFDF